MKSITYLPILLSLIIVSCDNSTEPEENHGCLDSNAINYNSDATIDNNSCEYNSCFYRWGNGLTTAPYFFVCFDDFNTQELCDEYYDTLLQSEYNPDLVYQYYDVNHYRLEDGNCEEFCNQSHFVNLPEQYSCWANP